jgi:hypothetical protein
MTLQEFIRVCSEAAAKMFHLRGQISPMWIAVTRAGERLMAPSPRPDNDEAVAMLRAIFEQRDVVRCVFIYAAWQIEFKRIPGESFGESAARARDEGWAVELNRIPGESFGESAARARGFQASFEVLSLTGEDEAAGLITARQRIIRPPRSAAYLGPLEISTPNASEGLWAGLLPQRGARQ